MNQTDHLSRPYLPPPLEITTNPYITFAVALFAILLFYVQMSRKMLQLDMSLPTPRSPLTKPQKLKVGVFLDPDTNAIQLHTVHPDGSRGNAVKWD